MASNYQDKINNIDQLLIKLSSNHYNGRLGIEFHISNTPELNVSFAQNLQQISKKSNLTEIKADVPEKDIGDLIDDLDRDLKREYEISEKDQEIVDDFEPIEDWEQFAKDTLNGLIYEWMDFIEEHAPNISEVSELYDELNTLGQTIENTSFLSFLPNRERVMPDLKDDLEAINKSIRNYNKELENFKETEEEAERVRNLLDDIDTDDEDQESDYEDTKEELDDVEDKLKNAENDFENEKDTLDGDVRSLRENFEIAAKTKANIENQVFEWLNDVKSLQQDIVCSLKENTHSLGKVHSQQVIDNQNNQKEDKLTGFVSHLKNKDFVRNEFIIDNKGMKYNHLVLFNDYSMAFKNQDGKFFKPDIITTSSERLCGEKDSERASFFRHEEDSVACLKTFMSNVIEHEFRKTPKYTKVFNKIVKEQCLDNANFSEVFEALSNVKKYQNVLKNKNFDIDDFMKNTKNNYFEKFNDKIDEIIKEHEVEKDVKKLFSHKYKSLINEETYQYFGLLYENNVPKETIKSQLMEKLAFYKTPEHFNSDLRKLSYGLLNWSPEIIKEQCNQCNADIIHEEDEKLIVRTNDFDACYKMGTPNWCISRSESFFRSYQGKGEQYIVYDFSKEPKDKKSMTGITFNQRLGLTNAHFKNDAPTHFKDQALNVAEIALYSSSENTKDKEMVINKCLEKISNDPEKMEVFFKKNESKIKELNSNIENEWRQPKEEPRTRKPHKMP